MSNTAFVDQDVEKLLAGDFPDHPDLVELADFVTALRSYRTVAPAFVDLELLAAEAAEIVTSGKSSSGLSPARRPGRRLVWSRPLAAAAMALVLLVGIGGVAVAADGSAPGDALHTLDLALERFGIGAGGVDERIEEADFLIGSELTDEGFALLAETLEDALADFDEDAAAKVQRHLELALTKQNPQAAASQLKVAALKAFIEANKGKGVGLDGKEFGQGVAQIAKSGNDSPAGAASIDSIPEETSQSPPGRSNKRTDTGPPETAGPKDHTGGRPDHAGPREDKVGPPDHAGPKKDQDKDR